MLYIHIPYCSQKCIYCDFFSGTRPNWDNFMTALKNEISSRMTELKSDTLTTIYLGGGTPSLMPVSFLQSLFGTIKEAINYLNKNLSSDVEITMEVNPEDVTEENAQAWENMGINRISMGIQSLDDAELKLLKRRHSAQKALDSIEIISRHFRNVNIDIIYGIPTQTIESLSNTIDSVLTFYPKHISAYALTYEKGTPMEVLRNLKKFDEVSEETYLHMDKFIHHKLQERGFERYEISNYALPGFRSEHNSGYWGGKEYLGCGPSASSFDGIYTRRKNPDNLKAYIEHWTKEEQNEDIFLEEVLTKESRIIETIFTSLRKKEGIDMEAFGKAFGLDEKENLMRASKKWIESGEVRYIGDRLELTLKGIGISDFIIANLI